jgi:hypothetical protein
MDLNVVVLFGVVLTAVGLAIFERLGTIRDLMVGPTQACRYCRRRYPFGAGSTYGNRTCYRRACRKRYRHYCNELNKARDDVLERWKATAPEAEGSWSNENKKRRDEEILEAYREVERWYGGDPAVHKKDE